MALVFAIFLVALLAVFLRPEGRADRFARVRALVIRGAGTGSALLSRGSGAIDRLSADLAGDDAGGLDGLLGPAERPPAAPNQ